MNLLFIDWVVILAVMGIIIGIAVWANRYTLGVADFLAANRCAGRYLLSVAGNVAAVGVITIVAQFEKFYEIGFASAFWYDIINPFAWGLALGGWVTYRYRQTKAMTMGQFFEIRYSGKFRIFSGIVAWVSGIINYGVFPAITARFFIYFCDLPRYSIPLGPFEMDITLGIVMFVFLSIALLVSLSGGQIAVMITDFFQGIVFNITFLILLVFLSYKFGLSNIVDSIKDAPAGESLVNPFDQANVKGFTWVFFALLAFRMAYSKNAWQGNQGYYCAAKNAHEARMANILGTWRAIVTVLVILMIPLAVYMILNTDINPGIASEANAALDKIGDEHIRTQLTVPVVLRFLLPPGLMGLFCAMMIAAAITTDDTSLHSWGTMFIQDVYMPLKKRKEALAPKKHLKLLRLSMVFVALFAWVFSMFFTLQDYIWMFFFITGAIYISGAGSAIIGGLYWKRGTKQGAWAAMIAGMVLAFTGIVLQNIVWKFLPVWKESHQDIKWLQNIPDSFPLNGMEMMGICYAVSMIMYIAFSLLSKPDPDFDMDKMLHRGKYAEKTDTGDDNSLSKLSRVLGITKEFTAFDKFIYYATFFWAILWGSLWIIVFTYQKIANPGNDFWAAYSKFRVYLIASIGTVCVFWFLFGGIRDMIHLQRDLSSAKRDNSDDGSVVNHQLGSEASEE
ncbi:MAG: sodium:solute symporter [Sedimentisphaeraceae bacterium JB056]